MSTTMKTSITFVAISLLISGAVYAQQKKEAKPEVRKPIAAEIAPLADKSIMNDIEAVTGGFIIVGERGQILLSQDGQKWTQVPVPTRAMLTRVHFVDAKNGWAVGYDGAVLRSADGGKSWTLKNFDSAWGKPYFDAYFTTPDKGLVIGANGRALRTEDNGETWNEVTNDVFDTGFNLYAIRALADGTLMIAGERGMLARSTDGGETWHMLSPPYIGSYFGVIPVGEHGAVLYGLQGRVFYAEDARKLPALEDPAEYDPFKYKNITDPAKLAEMGWRKINNPVQQSLFGGTLDSDNKLVLVGVDGTIVTGPVSTDSLKRLKSPTDDPISDVIVRSNELLLVGRNGIYHGKHP